MVTYNKRLQDLFHDYQKAIGRPGSLRDTIQWGLENGLVELPKSDPIAGLVSDLKNALRSETRVDDQGREYRANAAVMTFADASGNQTWEWGDVDRKSTPDDFKIENFAQRRKAIVSDCVQLKSDVDHYNGAPGRARPFQLILDYTDDVAEREAMRDTEGKKRAA